MKRAVLLHGLVLLTIACLALLPVFSVAIAGEIASANNCSLDEGSPHPCIINGIDRGETLYAMGVMGWLMLATLPLGLIVMVIYIVLVVIFSIARAALRRKRMMHEG